MECCPLLGNDAVTAVSITDTRYLLIPNAFMSMMGSAVFQIYGIWPFPLSLPLLTLYDVHNHELFPYGKAMENEIPAKAPGDGDDHMFVALHLCASAQFAPPHFPM